MLPHMTTYTVALERDENGWYVGRVLELPGCHTQGKTREQVLERIKEAIAGYLAVAGPVATRFAGIERVEVPA